MYMYSQPVRLTLQFLFYRSSRCRGQSLDKLSKLHQTIFVNIKGAKDVTSKLVWITKWEELMVDLAELLKDIELKIFDRKLL